MHQLRRTALLAGAAVLSVACSDDPLSPDSKVRTVDVLHAANDTVAVGDSMRLETSLLDGAGQEVSGAHVVWTTSDSSVVAVDSTGAARAKAVGRATLRASVGDLTDSVRVMVYRVELEGSVPSFYVGDAGQYTATLIGPDGVLQAGARSLSFESTDTLVARVDSTTGAVLASGHGTAAIVATSGASADTVPMIVSLPRVITPEPLVVAVPGGRQACGLTAAGVTYCWGASQVHGVGTEYGQPQFDTPVTMVSTSARFTSLSGDRIGTCGWTAEGATYCWGSNSHYALAPDTTILAWIDSPRQVHTSLAFVSGSQHYFVGCGLTAAGEMYCWGDGYNGTLGRPVSDPALLHGDSVIARAEPDLHFSTYATDGEATCGVATEGGIWCWGLANGLVQQPDYRSTYVPIQVPDAPPLVTLGIGYGWALCGATAAGDGYCLGSNDYGQLGRGTKDDEQHYTFAPIVGGLKWKQFAGAFLSMCGLTMDGKLYCWGRPAGYVGLDQTRPEPVAPSLTFRSISGTVWNQWYCAVTTEGQTYCFTEQR